MSSALIQWEGKLASLAMITDITERKQAEQKIRLQSEIMKVSGVYDISTSAPSANVAISNSQVARTGVIDITFT